MRPSVQLDPKINTRRADCFAMHQKSRRLTDGSRFVSRSYEWRRKYAARKEWKSEGEKKHHKALSDPGFIPEPYHITGEK